MVHPSQRRPPIPKRHIKISAVMLGPLSAAVHSLETGSIRQIITPDWLLFPAR